MKAYLKSILTFSLVLLGLILASVYCTEFIVKENANFKLESNPKYLVVGDSHPECAFNDSLMANFKNIAQSGESYFYTYFKTKQLLQHNPSIEAIFIELNNRQVNESVDEWIWGNNYMRYRYPVYSPFMSFSEKKVLFSNNPKDYINAVSVSLRDNLIKVLKSDYNYAKDIGGYLHLTINQTDSIINNELYEPKKGTTGISETNLHYLNLIIKLCEQNGIDVILIRSPLHPLYQGYTNESVYKWVLENNYSHIDYIDFSNFPLLDSEYGDLGHLNYKGAAIFSEFFSDLLEEGLLEEKEKDKFVAQKIKNRIKSNK